MSASKGLLQEKGIKHEGNNQGSAEVSDDSTNSLPEQKKKKKSLGSKIKAKLSRSSGN